MICLLIYVSSNYFHYLNDTGTNLYKQELFVMAIRTPAGRTFPGNFMIIPSAKKWVFHANFRHAFLSLYGECICSLNRLVVTDEENAEYRSFECLIEITMCFNFQELCCVPSMQFGNLLSVIYIRCCQKKTCTGKLIELTEVGQKWGDYQIFICEHFIFIIYDLVWCKPMWGKNL